MLVEDELIVAMDVQQRLETLGYEVVATATSGEEALRYSMTTQPNLVLMDIKIRGKMDGIDTAAKIRELQDIPVVFVTAYADEATLKRALVTEAFGYLIKPFEDRELRTTVEIALYKHRMEAKLRKSEERYSLAVRAANDGIWDWDLINGVVYYSPRWKTLLGLPDELEIVSPQDWLDRVHPDDIENLNLAISSHLEGITPTVQCEYRMIHQDGAYRWMLCRGLALFDLQNKPYRLAGSQTDITAQKEIQEQLTHRALHDELTGLPNRALFIDRLNVVYENIRRQETSTAAVLFLDIDHFKVVNDSMGHVNGDELLITFAHRVKQTLRSCDTVARFGGDEFAILVDHINLKEEVTQIADRIRIELQKPFSINNVEIFTSASIGIAYLSSHDQSVDDLMRDVDVAMYHAKFNGRARYEVFDARMHDRIINRLQIESEIRCGMVQNEFALHYQPIYNLNTLELVGFEALIRWQHPSRGLLLPSDFIPVAEKSGLILQLGEWALHTACSQAHSWQELTGKPLRMSVNLSALQFNDLRLVEIVESALNESHFNPALLDLELTESAAMRDFEKAHQILEKFQKMGVSISIDDFGCGYSSLDHLRYLPINSLKIDRSFIYEIEHGNSAIVSAIVTMAHQLKLRVIAEGVETENQLSFLTSIRCDQVQGFLLGRVLSSEIIANSILNQTS